MVPTTMTAKVLMMKKMLLLAISSGWHPVWFPVPEAVQATAIIQEFLPGITSMASIFAVASSTTSVVSGFDSCGHITTDIVSLTRPTLVWQV